MAQFFLFYLANALILLPSVFAVVCRLKSTATAQCICILWSLLSRYLFRRVHIVHCNCSS